MGWNKQEGEAWELQRTLHTEGDNRSAKALQLKVGVGGILTIEDAEKLATALVDEVWAARRSEGKVPVYPPPKHVEWVEPG
jgi:hypothetical protein